MVGVVVGVVGVVGAAVVVMYIYPLFSGPAAPYLFYIPGHTTHRLINVNYVDDQVHVYKRLVPACHGLLLFCCCYLLYFLYRV